MTDRSNENPALRDAPVLPPAERCVVCDRPHEEIGGQRLVAQRKGNGALLCRGDNPALGRGRIAVPGQPGLWLCLYGDRRFREDTVRRRALAQIEQGFHPWFCQHCGHRTCHVCGAPLTRPVGSDYITEDGRRIVHVGLMPGSTGCINPECLTHRPRSPE